MLKICYIIPYIKDNCHKNASIGLKKMEIAQIGEKRTDNARK